MKKFLAITLSAAILLVGCGKNGTESVSSENVRETQVVHETARQIVAIEMYESGGEDGRLNHWLVCDDDGEKRLFYDDRMGVSMTYYLTDSEYREFTEFDMAPYIGKEDNNDGICDAIYYHVKITYDDGTEDESHAAIYDLCRIFDRYLYDREPAEIIAPTEVEKSDNYMKEPAPEDIVTDEETGVSYVKDQLLMSVSLDVDSELIEGIVREVDAEIVGYIGLTGDYQLEFPEEKTVAELEIIADYLMQFNFVENVTLNIVSEITFDDMIE